MCCGQLAGCLACAAPQLGSTHGDIEQQCRLARLVIELLKELESSLEPVSVCSW